MTTPPAGAADDPVVVMRNVTIDFPGVKALDGVDFRLLPGEIHALMGENGAGKSTLIKALTGVYDIDSGSIAVDGVEQRFSGTRQAQDAGISTVYQEVNLCANLTVAENILLGREPRRLGRIDYRAMNSSATELLGELDLTIDPRSTLGAHPIAVQQLVAIARATAVSARVLILDEPTSSLDADEVAELFRVMRRLRDGGTAILFVSHFLDQVYEISDRMTVLRNGRLVGEYPTAALDRVKLVAAMLGHELDLLEEIEDTVAAAAAAGQDRPDGAQRAGHRPQAPGASDGSRRSPRGGRRPGRAARLRSDRAGAAALRRRPRHQRTDAGQRQAGHVALATCGHRQGARLLLGRSQGRGHHWRPQRARQPDPGAAGPPRVRPPAVQEDQGRPGGSLHSTPSTSGRGTPPCW